MGKGPTLITPSGRVIIESSAIAKYLIDTYDHDNQFRGDGKAALQHDSIRDEMLCSFANASMMPVAGIEMFLDVLTSQTPWLMRPMPALIRYGTRSFFTQPELRRMGGYLDGELEGREYFLGRRLSRADVSTYNHP
jgi:glutathione S-transferase